MVASARIRCEEQRRLTNAVIAAVERDFAAKTGHAQDIRGNAENLASSASKLEDCRPEERRAVKALEAHKRDHGCGTVK
jgi:hypothetical protein